MNAIIYGVVWSFKKRCEVKEQYFTDFPHKLPLKIGSFITEQLLFIVLCAGCYVVTFILKSWYILKIQKVIPPYECSV